MRNIYNLSYDEATWNSLVEDVLNKIDKSWSKDLIIYSLILNLAPLFQRDPMYFLANNENKRMYWNSIFLRPNYMIICYSLCTRLKGILERFDINSKVIKISTKNEPLYVLIVEGTNNKKFYIDPLQELLNNQLGLKMEFFGMPSDYLKKDILRECPDLEVLSKEYVTSLSKSLLPSTSKEMLENYQQLFCSTAYGFNDIIGLEHDIPISNIIERKIEFIGNEFINMGKTGPIKGIIERKQFYNLLFYKKFRMFKKSELGVNHEKISVNLEILEENDWQISINVYSEPGILQCRYEEEQQEDKYVLSRKK